MRDTVMRLRCLVHVLQIVLALAVFAAGGPSAHAGEGYAFLQDRPLPKTSAQRAGECTWIRAEQVRVQSQTDAGTSAAEKYNPAMAQSMRAEATLIQTQLQKRYAQIQCDLAPAVATPPVTSVAAQAATQPSIPVATPAPAPPPVPAPLQTESRAVVASPVPVAVQPVTEAAAKAPAEPVAAPLCPGGLTFDQCFSKCRELTKRTAEQCFDTCRH